MAAKKRVKAKAKAGGKGSSKSGAKKRTTKRKASTSKTAAAKRRARARKPAAAAKRRRQPRKAAAAPKRRRAPRRVVFESELAIATQRKGLAIAAEPPIDRDPSHFVAAFRTKLEAALAQLAAAGKPFRLVEGFRTTQRQQWLFGSGRPTAVPFGRSGPIVTKLDGVKALSRHQGNGTVGSGRAADCYPTKNGKVFIPKASDPVWKAYADAVVKQGLVAGLNFATLKDAPHCELPP